MNTDIFYLLGDLIEIPSSSEKERKIGKYLVRRLRKNFKVKIQKIGNRFNVFAYKGIPKIILTTHMDTVPKQLEIKEDKDYIYGRGACDAKASIASMIIAAEYLVKKRVTNIGLIFDIGEELDFIGIKQAIKLCDPEFVIIGEPTKFQLVIGQKGLLELKIKSYGISAPGSTPEKGISAINKLIQNINQIKKLKFKENKKLGKTTINIGKIQGGIATNIVPDYAEAFIDIRTTTNNRNILKILDNLNVDYEIINNYGPVMTNNPYNLQLEKITVPYFTEMYFWNKKAKAFVFGPGEYKYAHSDNEKIKKQDLIKAVAEYVKLITYLNKQILTKPRKEEK